MRRGQNIVSAAVAAVFAAVWGIAWAVSEPPEFAVQYLVTAIGMAVLATPWVIASRVLWRHWWARNSAMDGPARLVTLAVGALPERKRGWGAAMTAELAQVEQQRWRFAAGCALAAARTRGNVIVVASGVLVAAGVGALVVPELRTFAVAFTVFAAVAVAATTKRERHVGVGITAIAGVAAAIGVTAYFVTAHPSAVPEFRAGQAVFLAAALAGCLWLAVNPLRSKEAGTAGVITALVLCAGFVVTSRLMTAYGVGLAPYVLFAPIPIFLLGPALVAAREKSFRGGVEAAVHGTALGTVLVFVAGLVEAMHWYGISRRLLFDGESGYAIGVNLGDSLFWHLLWLPVWGLPLGVIGAAVGCRISAAAAGRRAVGGT